MAQFVFKPLPGRRIAFFLVLVALLSVSVMAQVQTIGQWSTMSQSMPINPIHVALLRTGKILVVAGSGNCPPSLAGCPTGAPYGPSNASGALLFDPCGGNIYPVHYELGHVLQRHGAFARWAGLDQWRHHSIRPFHGQPKSSIFDPATNTFSDAQNMAHGRWYPTVTTLGDGRVMTFSGRRRKRQHQHTVEIYTVGSGWSQQYHRALYPRPVSPHAPAAQRQSVLLRRASEWPYTFRSSDVRAGPRTWPRPTTAMRGPTAVRFCFR